MTSRKDRQAGQHLCIGIPGTTLSAATRRLLNTVGPGAIVLFGRNIEDAGELRALTRALRTEFGHRPLIAVDQENGQVNRLRNIIGEVLTIAETKKSGHVERAEDLGRTTGRWLHQFGIDIDFAPVLDLELFDEKTDNALRERCWGRTADEVCRWAGAFLEGLEREGVAACPKHFPGLGGATLDSHEKLPTIRRTREQILGEDVVPYVKFMRRLTAVMVGHGHYPAFDGKKPQPASLSKSIVTELLRNRLGFGGVILTDDMEMGAISQIASFTDAVLEGFMAGVDILLVCHTPEKMLAAHEALTKAIESGRIRAAQLAESRERIQRFRDEWTAHKV
ncbi:MAG TPA: beta-N-acetylhexosaminidase [Verrucomicrobiae bacterium]|nr:beta-N-acetylhexosaminidase [Verrucomicrobiae bacterium]